MDLVELRDRIQALPALEGKMKALQKEIQNAGGEVSRLLNQYEKERGDVETLQKESLSSFMLKLVGKYEDRLDREQREEINAKIAYDRASDRLENLTQECDMLRRRIADLRKDEQRYQIELADRRAELKNMAGQNAERHLDLENKRKAIIAQSTEIKEAMRALESARATALRAQESLKSAQGWATYDVFAKGGIISHMAKYSHIVNAEHNFTVLSSQLRSLRKELSDVKGLDAYSLKEISSTQRAVDFWFDNIFTDLSVRGQIKDNAEQISSIIRSLNRAESTLKSKMRECEARLDANRREEETLLASL